MVNVVNVESTKGTHSLTIRAVLLFDFWAFIITETISPKIPPAKNVLITAKMFILIPG
jgi:hypothetical protein